MRESRPLGPSPRPLVPVVTFLLLTACLSMMASGILIGPAYVQGQVTDQGGSPLEGVLVAVMGMEEYNATTDDDGRYLVAVPVEEAGHTLKFTHPDFASRESPTGPLEEDGLVEVNVTLSIKPPWATLHIVILPWEQAGSNYGLRQDYIYVSNASGTAFFQYSENSREEDVQVPAPGTYHVRATRPGYYPLTVTLVVDRGQRLDVDMDLSDLKKPTIGVVNGTVDHEGVPLEDAKVIAEPEEGTRTWQAVTDADGRFSMQLPEGNYSLRVEAKGYAVLSEGVAVVLGGEVDVHFPMSVAQDTGDEGGSPWFWVVLVAAMAVLVAVIGYATVTHRRSAAQAAHEATEGQLMCPACDAEAPKDADRCPACGATFPWRSFRCPDCGAVLELDARRCPECGNETFDLHGG